MAKIADLVITIKPFFGSSAMNTQDMQQRVDTMQQNINALRAAIINDTSVSREQYDKAVKHLKEELERMDKLCVQLRGEMQQLMVELTAAGIKNINYNPVEKLWRFDMPPQLPVDWITKQYHDDIFGIERKKLDKLIFALDVNGVRDLSYDGVSGWKFNMPKPAARAIRVDQLTIDGKNIGFDVAELKHDQFYAFNVLPAASRLVVSVDDCNMYVMPLGYRFTPEHLRIYGNANYFEYIKAGWTFDALCKYKFIESVYNVIKPSWFVCDNFGAFCPPPPIKTTVTIDHAQNTITYMHGSSHKVEYGAEHMRLMNALYAAIIAAPAKA